MYTYNGKVLRMKWYNSLYTSAIMLSMKCDHEVDNFLLTLVPRSWFTSGSSIVDVESCLLESGQEHFTAGAARLRRKVQISVRIQSRSSSASSTTSRGTSASGWWDRGSHGHPRYDRRLRRPVQGDDITWTWPPRHSTDTRRRSSETEHCHI